VDDLFDFPKLRVRQPGKILASRARYEIHGAGRMLAVVTETEAHTRLALISQHMPDTRTFEVTTPAGQPVLTLVKQASEWITELRGPAGELVGRIRTGDTRRTYTLLDHQDRAVAEVTGDLALKRFIVTGPSGARLARVRKTWAGPAKEMLTRSDHYKVEFAGPVPHPARTLTVMMPVLLDVTLYGPV
jgi:Scramblase